MDNVQEFLKKTECHFNWYIYDLDTYKNMKFAVKFKEKIEQYDRANEDSAESIWPLELSYAYELLQDGTEIESVAKIVKKVVNNISHNVESFTTKYRISFLHIARSFQAFLLMKSEKREEAKTLLSKIKPLSTMSEEECSGVFAMKAQVLRYYGHDGVKKGIPLLREAIRRNPSEVEWKLSLVISMHRKRHQLRGHGPISWDIVEEPVNILEDLLNNPDTSPDQKISCKYFLAVAYADYAAGQKSQKKILDQIIQLCDEIYGHTEHPMILSFCAYRFFLQNKQKGVKVLKTSLAKYPYHVGINSTACNINIALNDLPTALKHAQTALEGGGYGAAWLTLRCKVKLGEKFDEEEYFDNLLSHFPEFYTGHIHLNACLYYILQKQNVVKGAQHFAMALEENPFLDVNECIFSEWTKSKVIPVKVTYTEIVRALGDSNRLDENVLLLQSVKSKIEEIVDVTSFAESDIGNWPKTLQKSIESHLQFAKPYDKAWQHQGSDNNSLTNHKNIAWPWRQVSRSRSCSVSSSESKDSSVGSWRREQQATSSLRESNEFADIRNRSNNSKPKDTKIGSSQLDLKSTLPSTGFWRNPRHPHTTDDSAHKNSSGSRWRRNPQNDGDVNVPLKRSKDINIKGSWRNEQTSYRTNK